jgi:hypothetical protein
VRVSVNPYVDRLYFVSKKFQGPAKKFERCKDARAGLAHMLGNVDLRRTSARNTDSVSS